MSRYVLIILALLPLCGTAQSPIIKGTVVDAETTQPVPFAHVFIANTTIGAVTDENGRFDFRDTHEGPGQLIVSFLGYETFSLQLSAARKPGSLQIRLKPSQAALETVTVAATEDKEWQRQLKTFKKEFFGKTGNAASCEIANPWVLEFNKKSGVFEASASAPLEIVNRALGYEIIFYLNRFESKADRYSIIGPARFSELPTSATDEKVKAKRLAAFNGSMNHFFRLLWKNQHHENGFRIYRSVNALEEEQRTAFFERDLGVRVKEVKREDVVRNDNRGGLVFFSHRPVEIHYEPARDFEPVYRDVLHQVSWIQASGGVVRFDSAGNVLNPQDITVSGYWNRLRIGDMLPYDYVPGGRPQSHEPERLAIIPDKGLYTNESRLWYTVLVSGMSQSVYVQLLDSTNREIATRLDPVENGRATGSFVLPKDTGTFYLRALTSTTYDEGTYFVKPVIVASGDKSLACDDREGLASINWKVDSVGGKEMLALSLIDQDRDSLDGDFGISITAPGADCDCLEGKWLTFRREDPSAKLKEAVPAGKVVNKKGNPLRGKLVFLTDDLSSSFERQLGEDGDFRLDDVITFDSTRWLAQLYDEKDRAVEDFAITWEEQNRPAFPPIDPWKVNCSWIDSDVPVVVNEVKPVTQTDKVRDELQLSDTTLLLSEVTVRGRRMKTNDKPASTFRSFGTPTHVVTGEQLANAPVGTNLLNTLASRVPGLVFMENNNNWEGGKSIIKVRGKSSYRQQEDPLIILDGMPMDNFDLAWDIIQTIPVTDVEKIEVRTSLAAMQGLKGNNGIISIYTKRASGTSVTDSRQSAFIRQVELRGYSSPPRFVRDAKAGETVLWQPEVRFSWRPVMIDTSTLPSVFDVVITGFNSAGEVVNVRKRIDRSGQGD